MSAWTVLAILMWIALGFALGVIAFTAWHVRLGKKLLRLHIESRFLLDVYALDHDAAFPA